MKKNQNKNFMITVVIIISVMLILLLAKLVFFQNSNITVVKVYPNVIGGCMNICSGKYEMKDCTENLSKSDLNYSCNYTCEGIISNTCVK